MKETSEAAFKNNCTYRTSSCLTYQFQFAYHYEYVWSYKDGSKRSLYTPQNVCLEVRNAVICKGKFEGGMIKYFINLIFDDLNNGSIVGKLALCFTSNDQKMMKQEQQINFL